MAVQCEFIDFIIPIENIDKIYPGGFAQFKENNKESFSKILWNDDFLFRDGAMNGMDIEFMIQMWESKGLEGVVEIDEKKQWKDFCIVQGMAGGPTFPCEWIDFDPQNNCVSMKGKPKGEIIGRFNMI
jgi:hypothetical protein